MKYEYEGIVSRDGSVGRVTNKPVLSLTARAFHDGRCLTPEPYVPPIQCVRISRVVLTIHSDYFATFVFLM